MKILHSSDLHGKYKRLLQDHKDTDFDVWVDTGDFFPNRCSARALTGRVSASEEIAYQRRWLQWTNLPERLTDWLQGRPAVILPGNHDFVSLAEALFQVGANEWEPQSPFELQGFTFAGFREVPYLIGEWAGEVHSFEEQVSAVCQASPDILLTHAPPAGILDAPHKSALHCGIDALTTAFAYRGLSPTLHLFGHVHEHGGQEAEEMGIRFVNGAGFARIVEL